MGGLGQSSGGSVPFFMAHWGAVVARDGGAVGKRLAKKVPPGQTLYSNFLFSGASQWNSIFSSSGSRIFFSEALSVPKFLLQYFQASHREQVL